MNFDFSRKPSQACSLRNHLRGTCHLPGMVLGLHSEDPSPPLEAPSLGERDEQTEYDVPECAKGLGGEHTSYANTDGQGELEKG